MAATDDIGDGSGRAVDFGSASMLQVQNRPPLHQYQPEISPLANFSAVERARSAQQP